MITLKIFLVGAMMCTNIQNIVKPYNDAGIKVKLEFHEVEALNQDEFPRDINTAEFYFNTLKAKYGVSGRKTIVHYILPPILGNVLVFGRANVGCFKRIKGASYSTWDDSLNQFYNYRLWSLVTVQHEIGHQLGMVHAAPNTDFSIMSPTIFGFINGGYVPGFNKKSVKKAMRCLRRK